MELVNRLLGSGGELMTVILGAEAPGGLADLLEIRPMTLVRQIDRGVKVGGDDLALADAEIFMADALVDRALAGRLATAPATPVQGAQGSLVMSADAEKLANAIIRQLGAKLGPAVSLFGTRFTAPLGPLTASVKSTTAGMSGKLSLAIR